MNDLEIRQNFHRKKLQKQHIHQDTIVIDELGLNHGKNRADIAVINGLFVGYEIKSDNDSLIRLDEQVKSYNSIFDKAHVVVGVRYLNDISKHLPDWWGIIAAVKGTRAAVKFNVIRKARINKTIKPISIARLLWRNEVADILKQNNVPDRILRKPRSFLYQSLVESYNIPELKKIVRQHLKQRNNWRRQTPLVRYDDLCQPFSM